MLYALTDIKNFAEDDLVAFSPFLSLQRKQKIDRYKFFADKKISALAYLLLKSAYVIETGKRIMEDFEIGKYGKPYFKNEPFIQFNISHAREGVVCGISKEDIGVDITGIDKRNLDCIKSAMHPNEIRKIEQDANGVTLFTRFWSLKESYVKCKGTGISSKINMMDFSPFDEDSFRYELQVMQVFNDTNSVITSCSASVESIKKLNIKQIHNILSGT